MDVVSSPSGLRRWLQRSHGTQVGLVPTMGALHDGHLSLVARARRGDDVVVASVFVNPLQFGPGEDFDRYPRALDQDLRLLADAGVDVAFTPAVEELIPADAVTSVRVRGLTERLEGASRPDHFDGVTTIVAKLCNLVAPARAYFGEKDYQQLVVVRRMVRDLDMAVEVVGCPTVREADGLAMSSRNAYLSPQERRAASALPAALRAAAAEWAGDADATRATLRTTLGAAPGLRLDYAEVVHPDTVQPLHGAVDGPARAVVAAFFGGTRLIDNTPLGAP